MTVAASSRPRSDTSSLSNGRPTREKLLAVTEKLLVAASGIDQVTVRRIAAMAGANVAAINYHFGSRDLLILTVVRRLYQRLNAERLALLQVAVDERPPEPPRLDRLIAALVGPSVRWQLDPTSSYAAFVHFTTLSQQSRDPAVRDDMAGEVEHLRAFVPHFGRVAPHLSDSDVAWRIHCALGIRTQVTRSRRRGEMLIGGAMDFSDPDLVIGRMIEVIAPMFRPDIPYVQTAFESRHRSVSRPS